MWYKMAVTHFVTQFTHFSKHFGFKDSLLDKEEYWFAEGIFYGLRKSENYFKGPLLGGGN